MVMLNSIRSVVPAALSIKSSVVNFSYLQFKPH